MINCFCFLQLLFYEFTVIDAVVIKSDSSGIKQMKEPAFHFACLSWRQGVGLGVGLASNVTIMSLRDKAKSLRMHKVI